MYGMKNFYKQLGIFVKNYNLIKHENFFLKCGFLKSNYNLCMKSVLYCTYYKCLASYFVLDLLLNKQYLNWLHYIYWTEWSESNDIKFYCFFNQLSVVEWKTKTALQYKIKGRNKFSLHLKVIINNNLLKIYKIYNNYHIFEYSKYQSLKWFWRSNEIRFLVV